MSLTRHTTNAPIPFEPEHGIEVASLYPDAAKNIKTLINGVAGCSPYLRGLLKRERDWLQAVISQDPKRVIADILGEITPQNPHLAKDLRCAKRRIALYTALADLGGMWALEEVTTTLTNFADHAVNTALVNLLTAEFERGKLPGCVKADLETACGMSVLAMGKMGAHELNYSSDIDLIVLFDESRHAPEHFDDIRERFIRVTKRMTRMLSDVTAEGYVFRTDLRLRPDPSVTPVCISMVAAERYYESMGRTWERAAFIKARPCAGDLSAGMEFLDSLRPFVWRKHLDYAAIEDAHDMRLRIREHKGLAGPIVLPGHNMKLGRGGIREIEFFTQTRQIIAGGRDIELRSRETVKSLFALAEKGWISREAALVLSKAYRAHRIVEHRIQMLGDAQTHNIPQQPEQISRLANFCGLKGRAEFLADISVRLNRVHDLTESFFVPSQSANKVDIELNDAMRATIEGWQKLPALRTARSRQIFSRLKPAILSRILDTVDPDETLRQFNGFLSGLPAGVQLFSLFEANPQLLDLLVEICGSAPSLARYLSHNSAVFDGVIGGTFFEALPDVATLTSVLEARLAGVDDYETQLNSTRSWMKEQHFRIGVQHLKAMIGSEEAGRHYSDLAEAVLRAVLPAVCAEFARRHGPMPGLGAMVLGMGSLGSGSLTATSDLDLIVIYDALGEDASQGKRPLAVSTYYARLTQSLVTALSSPMAEGRLYEVDMRLRPSGRKGPVATPLSGFFNYQRDQAWTWEHLALTRARAVAGNQALGDEVEAFRREVIGQKRDKSTLLGDVRDMRSRLSEAVDRKSAANIWETKHAAGRMLDIELVAQTAALMAGAHTRKVLAQLEVGVGIGWLSADKAERLKDTYTRLRRIQQISRLLVTGVFDPEQLGQGGCALLLAETGADTVANLVATLEITQADTSQLIDGLLGRLQT
jgi:[glutamine synthetase] adenylyltransferase / [glutamine synthetase]-adenylyl-L-tyrosine phosphorylase